MKSWIHHAKGRVPRQAHVDVPPGLKEEEVGRGGFQGRVAELYRLHEPTAHTRVVGPYAPMDLDGYRIDAADRTDPRGEPTRAFFNEDVAIFISRRSEAMPFFLRNADGDTLYFVHRGRGTFETELGPLRYGPGDYVVLPRGITYRVLPKGRENFFLVVESLGEIALPDYGGLGRHNPFDPTVIEVPEPHAVTDAGASEWEVRVKRAGETTAFFYANHPMDVVGWKGDLFPFRFHNKDFRPVFSDRNHIPPTAFLLFQARGWVLCNFVPRPAEMERGVARLPYYHRNVDYDEIGFLHAGTMAGAPMAEATIMVHPSGVVHGPGEGARNLAEKNWAQLTEHDIEAVNIDTERPLHMSPEARSAAREHVQLITGA
jgi:homogentisate 1,2-dioxygenase